VGIVECNQVMVGIHLVRNSIVALLQIVVREETGSLEEHWCLGSRVASSDQYKDDDRVVLRVESLLD
jgi:hypothetical protein